MKPEPDVPPKIVDAVPLRASLKWRKTDDAGFSFDPKFFVARFAGIYVDNDSVSAGFAVEHIGTAHRTGVRPPILHEVR
jgi:hypothetical protein